MIDHQGGQLVALLTTYMFWLLAHESNFFIAYEWTENIYDKVKEHKQVTRGLSQIKKLKQKPYIVKIFYIIGYELLLF